MELEKKTIYCSNGKKEEEYWINKNGKLEREYKFWYENGNKWLECNYKDGKLEGEYKSWNEKGNKLEESYCKNGEFEGEYKSWHKNGNKWEESYCKKGLEKGIIKRWNEKGKLELWEYRINRKCWLKIKENYKKYKTLEKQITKRKRKKRQQTIKRLRSKIDGIRGDQLIYSLIMEYCGNEIIEEAIEK